MENARDRIERIEDLLRLIADEHHRIGAAFAGSQQLAHSDLRALFEVMDAEVHGDPLTPGRLGGRLGVTSGAVTGIVDRLEQAGHVERRSDPGDRRRTRLHQSEHGFRTAIAFFGPLGERSAQVASRFSDDELETVERFLALTADALRDTGSASPPARASGPETPETALRPPYPLVEVGSREEWREWLERNHADSPGAWVVTRRKSALDPGQAHVSSQDLNEECLCFGWIDSRPAKVDETRTALLCTPRKPGSGWSRVNKERVDRLLGAGLIEPAGLAAIERSRADGSWSALDDVETLGIPADLADALDSYPDARARFESFPPSTRRGILEWIASARRDATRAGRVKETAALAQDGKRANQWPRT